MQLNELFGDTADFEVITNTETRWSAYATVNNRSIRVIATVLSADSDRLKPWLLTFAVDGSFDKTGRGDQFPIFKLVVSMLKQFQKDTNPQQICMSAEESNRADLYKRMIDRSLSNWNIIKFHDEEDDVFVIAGTVSSEFPIVVSYANDLTEVGVRLGFHNEIIGYIVDPSKDMPPTVKLKMADGLGNQLKSELDKARKAAEEEAAKYNNVEYD